MTFCAKISTVPQECIISEHLFITMNNPSKSNVSSNGSEDDYEDDEADYEDDEGMMSNFIDFWTSAFGQCFGCLEMVKWTENQIFYLKIRHRAKVSVQRVSKINSFGLLGHFSISFPFKVKAQINNNPKFS